MKGNLRLLHEVKGAPDEISDEALMAACGKGDRAALGALFDRYYRDVHRFIARASGTNETDLDDLVQSAFLEIHRGAHRFRGDAKVRTWIFGVAANVVRHYVRSEKRRRNLTHALSELPEPTCENSPHHIVERRRQLRQLALGMRELSHNHRVVFVMCELEGMPGVEAAKALGIRQGTLWRRLHEARKKLSLAIERRRQR